MNMQPDLQVLQMLGGSSGMRADALIRSGIPLEALDNLNAHGVNAVGVGIINARTLRHRKAKGEALSQEEGDHLYRVSKIVVLAEAVFGNKDKAFRWLGKPHVMFDGLTALEAVATTPGFAGVEEALLRISHGFAA
jgi:putative toxin-antitoxin system antitoxin component (TIGR02293 family)